MGDGLPYDAERRELEGILASGILARAPALTQILAYVCEMHFAGRSAEIKEYNIAVEALGRPADFDPKRDSIVRVEAHRLRKRLSSFYETDGAHHSVRIVLRPGHYVPEFVRNGAAPPPIGPAGPAPNRLRIRVSWLAVVLTALATAAAVPWLLDRGLPRAPLEAPEGPQIRIRAGSAGEFFADSIGQVWQVDRYFTGGTGAMAPKPVRNSREPQIYESYREGTFRYDIPLAPGVYELRLHFFEPVFGVENGFAGGEASRIMQVSLNGKRIIRDFDLFAEAGPLTADVKVFKDVTPAPDGELHLEFSGSGRGSVLSAIEITPGLPGVMLPIRMVSRDTPYVDREGKSWDANRYVTGGRLVFRKGPLRAEDDPEIYRGERYGAMTYAVPVPPGRYTVILRFAETWFGPNHPGGGGAGERVFDILCNGVLLEQNLDVYREAGGSDQGYRKIFRHIEPNAQGKIVLTFAPKKNYAELNALEILDEANE
jgi:hypothetical protein